MRVLGSVGAGSGSGSPAGKVPNLGCGRSAGRDEGRVGRDHVRRGSLRADLGHPLRAIADDLVVAAAHEVPPHDDLLVERLPADQKGPHRPVPGHRTKSECPVGR